MGRRARRRRWVVSALALGVAAGAVTWTAWQSRGAVGTEGGYDAQFARCGRRYGISAQLLKAIGTHESGLNPTRRGAAREYGLMQILPSTARALGMPRGREMDPAVNIEYAAILMRDNADILRATVPGLSEKAFLRRLVGAYNAGVDDACRGSIPSSYVDSVLRIYDSLGGGDPTREPEANVLAPLPSFALEGVVALEDSFGPGKPVELRIRVLVLRVGVAGGTLRLDMPPSTFDRDYSPGPGNRWEGPQTVMAKIPALLPNVPTTLAIQVRALPQADMGGSLVLMGRAEVDGPGGIGRYPLQGLLDSSGFPASAIYIFGS